MAMTIINILTHGVYSAHYCVQRALCEAGGLAIKTDLPFPCPQAHTPPPPHTHRPHDDTHFSNV